MIKLRHKTIAHFLRINLMSNPFNECKSDSTKWAAVEAIKFKYYLLKWFGKWLFKHTFTQRVIRKWLDRPPMETITYSGLTFIVCRDNWMTLKENLIQTLSTASAWARSDERSYSYNDKRFSIQPYIHKFHSCDQKCGKCSRLMWEKVTSTFLIHWLNFGSRCLE